MTDTRISCADEQQACRKSFKVGRERQRLKFGTNLESLIWTFFKKYRFRGYFYHSPPKLVIWQIPSVPICSAGPAKSTYISICTLNMLLYFCSILADLHTIPDLMSCHVPKSSSEWHVIFVWSWTDDSILEAHQREPEQLLACYNDGN